MREGERTYRRDAREFLPRSPTWRLPTLELVLEAQNCRLCSRMSASRRVLSELNGRWDAKVLFVAEAPGRLGAERTGIPLFGDRTGDRFDELLRAMQWHRCDVFITNAVLCNPRDLDGNNSSPTRTEILNCSPFLRRTIDIVNPLLVISLGRVALRALALVCAHDLELRTSIGRLFSWYGRRLAVLYHPGPRTSIHRSWHKQLEDARQIAQMTSELVPSSSSHLGVYD